MNEPVAIAAAITTAIRSVLMAVVLFGVDLSPEQIAGIVLAVEAVLNIPLTIWARNQVTPVGS